MKYIYILPKYLLWIGIVGIVGTQFSDAPFFKLLCLFGLFAFVDIFSDFSVYKGSFFQIIGILKVKAKFKEDVPSVDNFKSEIQYCLPFEGEWVAINGCFSKKYSHSWGIPTQRYAYDFIKLDNEGKSFQGKFDEVNNYYCYDENILAPADGIVAEILNNANNSLILKWGKFISKARHIAGNYIVIKHADSEYSTLAHLKKDSITVKIGDTVSKGQVVAKCGNTGNSTEPHLHFQLQTGQNFYNSLALPIHFENINISNVPNYEKFDPRPHMTIEQIPTGYVTRGFKIKNL